MKTVILLKPSSLAATIIGVKFVKAANKLARKRWKKAKFVYARSIHEIAERIEGGKADHALLPFEDSEMGHLPFTWRALRFHNLFIVEEILAEIESLRC